METYSQSMQLKISQRFRPPVKRECLIKLFNEKQGSVVKVPSLQPENEFDYRFVDCQTYDEFELAVYYVFYIDHKKHGLMSRLARIYAPVYRHQQYNYIKDYFSRRRRARGLE